MTLSDTMVHARLNAAPTSPVLSQSWFRDGCRGELGIEITGDPVSITMTTERFDVLASDYPGASVSLAAPDHADAISCLAVQVSTDSSAGAFPAALAHTPDGHTCLVASIDLSQALSLKSDAAIQLRPVAEFDVDAVVFDLDGTLVNSLDAYFEVARVAAESRGRSVTRDFVRSTLDANNHAFWELVFTDDEPDREANISAVKQTAREHWPEIQRTCVTALPGIDTMLQTLHARSLRLGIVTAGSGTTVTPLEQSGTAGLIECTITRADVAEPKPDPQGLTLALEQLGVPPSRALYIGDSRVDVQTARNAGVTPLAVLTGAGTAQSLAAVGPARVLPTLDALSDLIVQRRR